VSTPPGSELLPRHDIPGCEDVKPASIGPYMLFAATLAPATVAVGLVARGPASTQPTTPRSGAARGLLPVLYEAVPAKLAWPTVGHDVEPPAGALVGLGAVVRGACVGDGVGLAVGEAEGLAVGEADGLAVGEADGLAVGEADGLAVGEAEGLAVGEAEGLAVGEADGLAVGEAVGLAVGEAVGLTAAGLCAGNVNDRTALLVWADIPDTSVVPAGIDPARSATRTEFDCVVAVASAGTKEPSANCTAASGRVNCMKTPPFESVRANVFCRTWEESAAMPYCVSRYCWTVPLAAPALCQPTAP